MKGYGFVQMEDAKSVVNYKNNDKSLDCTNTLCTKIYSVSDEHTAQTGTFKQSDMAKSAGGNIAWDPFTVNMMNPDGDFTKNQIDLWYYRDVKLTKLESSFAYANEGKPILIGTDFYWSKGNDFETFRKHANLTCRFTSTTDATKIKVTPAIMESSPIGQYSKTKKPDQIRCRSPRWGAADTATLDVSVNGQDYLGSYKYEFVEKLEIYRISPLSGPLTGSTKLKLYGSGFNSSIPWQKKVYVKFGTADIIEMDKSNVADYTWSDSEYHDDFNFPKTTLRDAEINDVAVVEGTTVRRYMSA